MLAARARLGRCRDYQRLCRFAGPGQDWQGVYCLRPGVAYCPRLRDGPVHRRCTQSIAEVVECHLMAGECDVMLRVVAADLTAYRKFQIEHLTRLDCVRSVKTEVPMEQAKLTSELPI